MARRRRSIYSTPKIKLKKKTIIAIGSLVSFILAGLSLVTIVTDALALSFWRDFLKSIFGWTFILSPVAFVLSGLVLQKVKWGFAQANVLLGFILVILATTGLTGAFSAEAAGEVGYNLWIQLASFVTNLGAGVLLLG